MQVRIRFADTYIRVYDQRMAIAAGPTKGSRRPKTSTSTMKSFLQSDWGPSLRQAARTIGHTLALVWTLAAMGRDAVTLINDELATVAVAAPVAPPPAPAKPPRKIAAVTVAPVKPRPARRRKAKAVPVMVAA
jgi:hypothetical protein